MATRRTTLTYRDGGTNLLRQQVTEYVPKDVVGGVYIVNRPSRQRLLDATGACQGETRFVYDDQTGYTDPPIKGDLTKVRTALTTCGIPWSDTSYGYDVWGNQTTMTDPRGNTTTTAYDTTAGAWPMLYVLPTSTTAPLVGATSYGWDKVLGQVMSVTDPNNAVTSYEYDQWGRQWKEIRPDDTASNPTARISYTNYTGSSSPFWIKEERRDNASKDGSGNPIPATYLETRTFYDGLGRVVQTQAEAASASQSILADTQYNPLGLAMAQVTPYSYTGALGAYRTPNWTLHRSENSYDALGRVTQSTVKVGGTQISALRTYYQDRKAAVIDPLNHQTIRETDALGRLVSVKQYTGAYTGEPGWSDAFYAESRYGYGVADRLEDVWDPGNNNTHIVYDALGRKTNMTDPDMGAWSYAYDEASNLTRQTDAKNQRLCFYYDALNRLKGKTYSTGVAACPADPGYTGYAVKVYYDTDDAGAPVANGLGRRTGMMDGSSSAAWTYDSRGRVTNDTRTVRRCTVFNLLHL